MAFDKHGEGQLGRSAEGDGGGAMSSMFHILHGDMHCTCTCTKIETCCYHDNIVINTLMCLYIAVDVHVHVHVHVSFAGLVPPPQTPGNKSHLIVIKREELKAKKYATLSVYTPHIHTHSLTVPRTPL